MESGLALVRAHVESFYAGRTEDYPRQVAAGYRHHYLPDNLGEGPEHVQRWRKILFDIYREWRAELDDEHDNGDEVIVRINFVGRDPSDPSMPPMCESSAVLHYKIADGKLASCHCLHAEFDAFAHALREHAEQAQEELR